MGRGREGRTGLGRVGGVGVFGAWSVVARPLLSCSGVTMPCDQPAHSDLHRLFAEIGMILFVRLLR